MATTFVYPTNAELNEIAQDLLPKLVADRLAFSILPTRDSDFTVVEWEQLDNFLGLQQVRGVGGEPARVKRVGLKRYMIQPGVYGEFIDLNENELLNRRQIGSFNQPIDLTELVLQAQNQLLQRRLDRVEYIIWTLLATGTFSIANGAGSILHTDTFTPQTFSASVVWATAATATPLADFRAVKLKHRGHSVSFGTSALAIMNQTTFNQMIGNTNDADLYGRRVAGLALVNNLPQFNALLAGDDLPTVVVYDEGYLDDTGTFQLFVPNNKVIVVGKRPGNQVIGNYVYTRNANNPNFAPGPYMAVIDSNDHGHPMPRRVDVLDSHNGGPALLYGSAIVVMTV